MNAEEKNQNDKKKEVAEAALEYIEAGDIVGVGTGSTADYFIDGLAKMKANIEGTVASSEASAARLLGHGIDVLELNDIGDIRIYVDGADESTKHLHLIKGRGGALTREKIVAEAAEQFICIADQSKLVDRLGRFPLSIEVIPMARSLVARKIVLLGGQPEWRMGVTTDNSNVILDVHGLDIENPVQFEQDLNQIPGIVTVGLFALRGADVLLLGTDNGVETIKK